MNALDSLSKLTAKKSDKDGVPEGTDKTPAPALPAPAVRARAKTPPAEVTGQPEQRKSRVAKTKPKDPKDNLEVSWSNFKGVMEAYDLTEAETTELLLKVVGPDNTGSSFWTSYQVRIKKELAEEHDRVTASVKKTRETTHEAPAVEPPKKRLRKVEVEVPPPPLLPDNQLGDPSLFPEDTEIDGVEGEGEEEEFMDDDLEIPVFANGGGDDDQDSPA